ncbi:MAG TPA: L-histidine N(alpha)-methyltransferase [Burkholderiaceae bacterium]|nr:L-histidine N(alpha)-methyltransferase [Burkholderiaceae bacterium]
MSSHVKLLSRAAARPQRPDAFHWPRTPAALRALPQLIDTRPDSGDEIRSGLGAETATLAPKFLYDALGSRLFDAITELPEYYLTRVERQVLDRARPDIAAAAGRGGTFIDLGAGNCAKAASLFDALAPSQYVAVDIAEDMLSQSLNALRQRHPEIEMIGLAQDFSSGLSLPPQVRAARRLFFYPGSSIGNFVPGDALRFATMIRDHCGNDGHLLLGVDLVKDPGILEAAYDDALGVTRAFNLNLLNHVNVLIGADFNLRDWAHRALYNRAQQRIEMHLEALRDLVVTWPGGSRAFLAGERIHTENSYKFELPDLAAMLRRAGFARVATWTDDRHWFGACLASA